MKVVAIFVSCTTMHEMLPSIQQLLFNLVIFLGYMVNSIHVHIQSFSSF